MERKAEDFARQQREISISEFFEKNRHLLGYDNKVKALLMIVKEGVDNALDATEEAGILPDIYIRVKEVKNERYEIIIKDNGPGIVKKQIPRIFGKLLYGSKFHRLKQNRGQQGIGISAATLYTQLTTGEPLEIVSSTGDGKTHKYRIKINVRRNEPLIIDSGIEEGVDWRGVQLRFLTEGLYREYKQSILEYLKQTAISNPHARIVFDSPNGRTEFRRGVESLPKEPKEIRPHLHGVELGILTRMLRETKARTLLSFLTGEFTKVGRKTAKEICSKAEMEENKKPKSVKDEDARKLLEVIKDVKLLKPPTDCLSPLGNEVVKEGLRKELNPEWVESITRPPEVYRGWPFQVECGLAYGGSIQEPKFMRFANRVPLLYQQGDCAITKSVTGIDWRRYKINGKRIPEEPLAIFVHLVSVWVPFTSESKEAIASYPVIIKEIKLAIQECARKLGLYLSGKRKHEYHQHRIRTFERYAEETIKALSELSEEDRERVKREFLELINSNNNKITEEENGGAKEAEKPGEERDGPDREERKSKDRASRQVTLERLLR
ncbi:MAG: DNA topoisomerase VI subunit B [Candidatus Aenigmarchaeota archaeon]|nr:DNA topoisomerase VI subunit B [Candidatus Aenigmarchaeota archaeon]NIP40759.1 DNA topoisomerase VI subunit B [Candidatus Aenigmarchaeota archaeon]NIQ18565.1 DNA topoisomerase VI subunit B [Candidatus Aenigmarchaeota archaeon]NIS73464.1 DNA topoisomerase VI subunit B [Candidatus Aenigmarchaeota archaeon]